MIALPYGLLVAAGLALILQNLIMAAASERFGSLLMPLVLNSAVGLVLLAGLLLWQGGAAALHHLSATVRPIHFVPGLLGSFVVFASLSGFRTLGAAPTLALLLTSQLIFGLGADWLRAEGGRVQIGPIIGVALLIAGSWLILFRRG